MKKNVIKTVAILSLVWLSGCQTKETTVDNKKIAEKADIVLTNGTIQTMKDENDIKESLAIKGDKIIYVGSKKDIENYISKETKVIDLKGKMVIPGFEDGHLHGPGNWLDRLYSINLEGLNTHDEYIKAATDFVKKNPDKKSYFGTPFSLSPYLKENGGTGSPHKEELDKVSKDKPIVMLDTSRHSVWVNSKALELANINSSTPDPSGGVIVKDDSGEPTGFLIDTAADLVHDKIEFEYTDEMKEKAILEFQKEANSLGITAFTNILVPGGQYVGPEYYKRLNDNNKLSLRIRNVRGITPDKTPEEAIREIKELSESDSDMMSGGTAKLFYDGVTEGATAYMSEPYDSSAKHGDNWYGETIWDEKSYIDMTKKLDKSGIQIHTHAIGDEAVKKTLDAFEVAEKENGKRDSRHTITHVSAIQKDDIQRFSKLNVVAALQFLWMYKDELYELEKAYVGEERAIAMYPTKEMWDAGIKIAGASDAPVTGYNPLEEIEVAVTRNNPYKDYDQENHYRNPKEALTPYQALEAYTKNVSYENFMDKEIGTLEVGKKADITVLSDNILKIDSKDISDTKVLYTISNGKLVYEMK